MVPDEDAAVLLELATSLLTEAACVVGLSMLADFAVVTEVILGPESSLFPEFFVPPELPGLAAVPELSVAAEVWLVPELSVLELGAGLVGVCTEG